MSRPLFGWAAAAALSVLVGACSGGGTSPPTPGQAATAAPSASSAKCPPSSGLSGAVSDHGTATATGSALTLDAGDFFFAPTCETSVPRGTVTITIKNTGSALHNISVPDQKIDMDVAPGQTITVQLKLDTTAVPFFCKYHRTSGMVGSLIPAS